MKIIAIDSRRELFVDPYLFERFEGPALRLHRPQPQEVSLTCDQPWELAGPGYPTVLHADGCYHMYYRSVPFRGAQDSDQRQLTCYAKSDDGVIWRKPELGLIEFEGSTRNNILWQGVMSHNFTPFVDTNPACPPDQRYKAVGGCNPKWGGEGLVALVSADGIHWRRAGAGALALDGNFDSQNAIFWDSVHAVYRAYWRDHRHGDSRIPDGRDIRTATSPDFAHWSDQEWLDYDPNRSGSPERDQTDDPSGDHHQLYTNGVLPYPRAPHLLLGFPQRYTDRGWTASTESLPERGIRRRHADQHVQGGRPTRSGTVVSDVLFMASRDGTRFHVWPEAFVRPGIQRPGSWYYGGAWCAWGMVETASAWNGAPNELSLYIQEGVTREGPGRLRRHTQRLDGFASLYAPLTGGRAVTKPLTFAGDRLSINFSTSGGGRLRIGLQEPGGNEINDFSLDDCDLQYGDELARIVSWRGRRDLRALRGQPLRMVMELKDADLYSFVFTPAEKKNHE